MFWYFNKGVVGVSATYETDTDREYCGKNKLHRVIKAHAQTLSVKQQHKTTVLSFKEATELNKRFTSTTPRWILWAYIGTYNSF